MDDRHRLSAAPRKYDCQRKNCDNKENGELQILTAAEKSVEMPVVFGPWHDGEQETSEQEKEATAHGMGLRESIDGGLSGEQRFLQAGTGSEVAESGSNGEKRDTMGDKRFSEHHDPGLAEGTRLSSPSTDSWHLWSVRCILGRARLRILREGIVSAQLVPASVAVQWVVTI